MNIADVREDLATLAQTCNLSAVSFVAPDPSALPGAMSGLPEEMVPLTLVKWRMRLPLTLLYSIADPEDAQRRLDSHLSSTTDDSLYAALRDPERTADARWESVRWIKADNVRTVSLGDSKALACDVTLEFVG